MFRQIRPLALIAAAVVVASAFVAVPLVRAGEPAAAAPAGDGVVLTSVDALSAALVAKRDGKKAITVCDANSVSTRRDKGVVPGAVLLPSSSTYDLALLPKDKAEAVVFYCYNDKCMASHTAARRASAAGYSDVKVLSAGIVGWIDAGKAVDKPTDKAPATTPATTPAAKG